MEGAKGGVRAPAVYANAGSAAVCCCLVLRALGVDPPLALCSVSGRERTPPRSLALSNVRES